MRALGRAHGPMRDTLLSTLRAGRQASRSLPQIGLRVAQEISGLRASSSASVAKSMRVRSAWSGTLSLFKGAKPLTWEGGPSSMPDRRPGGPALPLQPARFDSAVNSRDCVLLFSREFAANDGDLRDFFAALHLGLAATIRDKSPIDRHPCVGGEAGERGGPRKPPSPPRRKTTQQASKGMARASPVARD